MRLFKQSTALFISLLLIGCVSGNDNRKALPLEGSEVAPTLETNMKSVGASLDSGMEWLENSETLGCMTEKQDSETHPAGDDEFPMEEESQGMADVASDLVQFLNEEILTTLEESDGAVLTYRLQPTDMFCQDTDEEGVTSINEECAEIFTDADVTIQVASYSEGDIEMTLVINSHKPLTLKIHQDKLAVELDLAEIKAVWELIAENFPADEQPPFTVNKLQGVVSLGLENPGTQQVRAYISNTTAVTVDALIEGEPLNVSVAPSEGSIILDQVAQSIIGSLNVGAIDISAGGKLATAVIGDGCGDDSNTAAFPDDFEDMPMDEPPMDECEPTEIKGTLGIAIGGITGAIELTDSAQNIVLKGLGLGKQTTRITMDGQDLIAIDLNAELGRMLDATVSLCDDAPQLAVNPGLNLALKFSMSPLTDTFPELKGTWMENETLSIILEGESPALGMDPFGVISGELRMESKGRPELNVTVGEGQCMGSTDSDIVAPEPWTEHDDREHDRGREDTEIHEEDDDHPFSGMEVSACEE